MSIYSSVEEKIIEIEATIQSNEEFIEAAKAENKELRKKAAKLVTLRDELKAELGITDEQTSVSA